MSSALHPIDIFTQGSDMEGHTIRVLGIINNLARRNDNVHFCAILQRSTGQITAQEGIDILPNKTLLEIFNLYLSVEEHNHLYSRLVQLTT